MISFSELEPLCDPEKLHCIKGEALKSSLFWRFSGGVWFSEERLLSQNSAKSPWNSFGPPIFTNNPCRSTCLCNAPSLHTVDKHWSQGSAERIWGDFLSWSGEFSKKCLQVSQQISSANYSRNFGGLFLQGLRLPPKKSHPKFMSKIVSVPLQFHIFEPKICFKPIFCLRGGDTMQ